MDFKINECDIKFLENENIKNPVKMKYLEEYFKDKKHIRDTKLQNIKYIKNIFTIFLHIAIVALFVYAIVVVEPFLVERYTSSVFQKIQNDK